MKILITPYNWQHAPIAGGEIYLMRLLSQLPEHEYRIITGHNEAYKWKGIDCYPQGPMERIYADNNDHFQWCDVVLCQLIGTSYGYTKAQQHNKPIIFIAHNNATNYMVKHGQKVNIIYNSYQLRQDLTNTFGHFNGIVMHPLLSSYKYRGNKYVTLVNCNANKGGNLLVELAKILPNIQFLGVLGGYGDQVKADLPNLTYLPNGSNMETVYNDTKLLIVPSEFESYSQASLEAMQCGIPVIAHTTPGLKENLSYAGIFIDRYDIQGYANKILSLLADERLYNHWSELCLKRIDSVEGMLKTELVNLKRWLNNIV